MFDVLIKIQTDAVAAMLCQLTAAQIHAEIETEDSTTSIIQS